jgi:hypothetical protein
MRWPSKWPFNLNGDQIAAMLLCPTLAVGLGYYIFFWRPGSGPEPRPSAVGWNDLVLCSELSSFDGMKSLALHEDGRADLVDHTSPDNVVTTKGKWRLRPGAKDVYEIDAPGATGAYTLVAPQDPKECMLAAGEADHVDPQLSWFPSDTFEEPLDEDAPDTSP